MTIPSMTFRHRRMRAPAESGSAFFHPLAQNIHETWNRNQREIASLELNIAGKSIQQWRAQAQQDLVDAAFQYTRQYRDCSTPNSNSTILSGHQPQLFHPGVWFKNFVLHQLGRQFDAQPVNLLIDNDLCGVTKIPVPSGSADQPTIRRVPFDQGGRLMPFENRTVNDQTIFENFASETSKTVSPFVNNPLVDRLWPDVLRISKQQENLGQALAGGRNVLESEFGIDNLELPLSQVCQSEVFGVFFHELIGQADRFFEIYNRVLQEYREFYGIKNRSQPLPDLARVEGYMEMPFWIWTDQRPSRQPLFVKQTGDLIKLSNLSNIYVELPVNDNSAWHEAFEKYAIRPRALATTMFSRLFLCDMFIHGIGGAKYDELTDQIAESFLNVKLPEYLTSTATIKFDSPIELLTRQDLTQYRVTLREMQYHPEEFVENPGVLEANLIFAKKQLIEEFKYPAKRLETYQRVTQINQLLQSAMVEKRNWLTNELADERQQLQRARILGSREYSFCLFDESLVETMKKLTAI